MILAQIVLQILNMVESGKNILFLWNHTWIHILHQIDDLVKNGGKVSLGEMESVGIWFLNALKRHSLQTVELDFP